MGNVQTSIQYADLTTEMGAVHPGGMLWEGMHI